MPRIPIDTQTLYAELLEQLTALELHRSIGNAAGSFVTKAIKENTYYYFQHTEPGGTLRQVYIGRQSPSLDKLVARFETERKSIHGDR